MSRTYRQQTRNKLPPRTRRLGFNPLKCESLDSGFTVFRALSTEQTLAARDRLTHVFKKAGGLQMKGFGVHREPGVYVFSKSDTPSLGLLNDVPRQKFLDAIYERIPSVRQTLNAPIHSVGRFGNPSSSRVSIAASLDTEVGNWPDERSDIQTLLSEYSGWLPIPIRPVRPHVTLIIAPNNTPAEIIQDIREEVSVAIGNTLSLDRALIK